MAPRKRPTKKVTFSDENKVHDLSPEDHGHAPVPSTGEEPLPVPAAAQAAQAAQAPSAIDPSEALTHVVVQLPISAEHRETLLAQDDMCNPLEYNPQLSEPTAYTPMNFFSSKNDEFANAGVANGKEGGQGRPSPQDKSSGRATEMESCKRANCFWCCHAVEHQQFGMPIRYDPIHNNFAFFGTFCSMECASAYNFSVHMGSDRAWDVQSWIQIMARNYGIQGIVRPAPSRYTLKMFDGPLTIEEFRNIHKGMARSVMVNIPPLVSMKPQIESINTSFFSTDIGREPTADVEKKPVLRRKAPANEASKTLEGKMNLSCTSLTNILVTEAP